MTTPDDENAAAERQWMEDHPGGSISAEEQDAMDRYASEGALR